MGETPIMIQSEDLKLEGLLGEVSRDRGVIVTHPHSLYGGDMHNNVVAAVAETFRDAGYTTLRFNFRGVGQSQGRYSEGVGEQRDVRAAVMFLAGMGTAMIGLVGYSFGAWVNALALPRLEAVRQTVMVSPPVGFLDFSFLTRSDKIALVITGSQDDIAPPERIRELLPSWNPHAAFEVIQGADHFYWGKTGEIREAIYNHLFSGLTPRNSG